MLYYVVYFLLYLISLLPFWALYCLADLLYVLLYKLFGYRVAVCATNLKKSFPEKTDAERLKIQDKFYRNLCDSIVETIKLLSISKKELDRRISGNWELVAEAHKSGRVAQGHLSHLFNWEWGTVICNWKVDYQFTGLYNPVSSKVFNRLMLHIRGRSGTRLVDMDNVLNEMAHHQQQNTLWGFIADQNPSEPRRGVWLDFLHQKTVFFKGAELIARRYNNIVFFGRIVKIKRGYYRVELTKAFDEGGKTKDGEITQAYVRFLEQCIREQPENWVWSHRRWKHKFPQTA